MKVEGRESKVGGRHPSREQFEKDGFAVARTLLKPSETERLRDAVAPLLKKERAGVRNLLRRSEIVAALARSAQIIDMLAAFSGALPFAVRGILFDKTSSANWQVAWHQDLTIAVKQRAEVAGFGPWSVKAGITHAQAPPEILARMLALRIHLDHADERNGALRVVSGSHRFGKMTDDEVERAVEKGFVVSCEMRAGAALIMRPLLLHASRPALAPTHRRVIHIEYAVDELPAPLEWFERA